MTAERLVDGTMVTGAEALVATLVAAGVDSVFGLASGKLGPLFAAIAAEPAISFVGVRHEASAAMMATGHYAGCGRIAVCLGETGPGGLNLLSGIGGAAANGLAVLAITSSNPLDLILPDRGCFSSTDNVALFRPLAKWSERAHRARRIPELVAAAIRAATSGAPGPVHLDVPADVLAERFALGLPQVAIAAAAAPAPAEDAVTAAVRLLRQARRPLLIGGGGVVSSPGGAEAFRTFADKLGAPVVVTQMGTGILPGDAALLIGQGGLIGGPAVGTAIAEADIVLAIGCRFSSWMWCDGPPGVSATPDRRLIHVDIDPLRIGAVLPAEIGIVADAAQAAAALADAIGGTPSGEPDWLGRLQVARDQHRRELDALARRDGRPLHPAAVARTVGTNIGKRGHVVFDGGHTTFWSNDFTPVDRPRSRFHEPGMTHLGFGLPWAIALKRLNPQDEVICITGDGAFGFTLQELDTARREGLPITVVVHDNAAFGVIAFGQSKAGFSCGTDLAGTDYAAIARGFGCRGERIDELEGLAAGLDRARLADVPTVLDVVTKFEPHPMLATFARSTAAPEKADGE